MGNEWRISEERPGYYVTTVRHGKVTVAVYKPILTEEEEARRDKQIINSIARLGPYYARKRKAVQTTH